MDYSKIATTVFTPLEYGEEGAGQCEERLIDLSYRDDWPLRRPG